MDYNELRNTIDGLIHRLDALNWEHCNSMDFHRLITEVKGLLEDIAMENQELMTQVSELLSSAESDESSKR